MLFWGEKHQESGSQGKQVFVFGGGLKHNLIGYHAFSLCVLSSIISFVVLLGGWTTDGVGGDR